MKLRMTHFHDPEPKEFDDRIDNVLIWHNKGEFDKAHSAWKARQVKPELEWIDGKIKKPKKGEEIYWRTKGIVAIQKNVVPSNDNDWFMNNMFEKEWCYCVNHDKALQHYEENRLRYEGFVDEMLPKKKVVMSREELLRIDFFNDGLVEILIGQRTVLRFELGLSVSLFEQICSENNIELNKL